MAVSVYESSIVNCCHRNPALASQIRRPQPTLAMPVVRGLERYLRDRGLIRSASVSRVLRGSVVAADAYHWVQNCSDLTQEPMQPLISPTPLSLGPRLTATDAMWQEAGVGTILVFPGLPPRPLDRPSPFSSADNAHKRQVAWRSLRQGNDRTAAKFFADANRFVTPELSDGVREWAAARNSQVGEKKARESGILDAFVSPYHAYAQLFWLEAKGFANCVFAPLDALVYPVRRLVTRINIKSDECEYVDMQEMLDSLQLNHSQFIDLCLIAGRYPCSSLRSVQPNPRRFFFKHCHEAILKLKTAEAVVNSCSESEDQDPKNYLKRLDVVRRSIRRNCALGPGGALVAIGREVTQNEEKSKTLGEAGDGSDPVFGIEPPSRIIKLIARGLLWPGGIAPLLLGGGVSVVNAPAFDSDEAALLNKYLAGIRGKGLARLRSALVRSGVPTDQLPKKSQTFLWFARARPVVTEFGAASGDAKADSRLNAGGEDLPAQTRALASVLAGSAPESTPLQGAPKGAAKTVLEDCTLRMLATLGLCDEKTCQLTKRGTQMLDAIREKLDKKSGRGSDVTPKAILERLLLLQVLLDANAITPSTLSLVGPGGKIQSDSQSRKNPREVRIASRMACAAAAPAPRELPWTGPVDRDLAAFGEMTAAATRCLRVLAQVCMASAVLDSEAPVDAEFCSILDTYLPFASARVDNTAAVLLKQAVLASASVSVADVVKGVGDLCPEIQTPIDTLAACAEFFGLAKGLLQSSRLFEDSSDDCERALGLVERFGVLGTREADSKAVGNDTH